MVDLLASLEQLDSEVRHAAPANLSLLDESRHLAPGILDGGTDLIGPVELVEVDTLHSESTKRCLALVPDRIPSEDAARSGPRIALVPHDPTLREDVWPLPLGNVAEKATYHLFRVTQPVRRRRIYPVEPQLDRVAKRVQRGMVVLWSPVHEATRAADGPGTHADARDARPVGAERGGW